MSGTGNRSAYRARQEARASHARREAGVSLVLGAASSLVAKSSTSGKDASKMLKAEAADSYVDGLGLFRQARAFDAKGKHIGNFIARSQASQASQAFVEANQHYEQGHMGHSAGTQAAAGAADQADIVVRQHTRARKHSTPTLDGK